MLYRILDKIGSSIGFAIRFLGKMLYRIRYGILGRDALYRTLYKIIWQDAL